MPRYECLGFHSADARARRSSFRATGTGREVGRRGREGNAGYATARALRRVTRELFQAGRYRYSPSWN